MDAADHDHTVLIQVRLGIDPSDNLDRQILRAQEESRARRVRETRERLELEDREAQERAARLAKELKGRKWVLGVDGEVE